MHVAWSARCPYLYLYSTSSVKQLLNKSFTLWHGSMIFERGDTVEGARIFRY
jgi:hypothetical protein